MIIPVKNIALINITDDIKVKVYLETGAIGNDQWVSYPF